MSKTLFALLLAASVQASPVSQLKILSFNIWVQGGLSLSNCVEVIRTSEADLVGLQECNATTAQTIGTALGFYVLPANDCSIVSRYPIIASYTAGNSRGATVEVSPNQRVHLFNCHLPPFPYGPYDLHDGQSVAYVTNQENTVRMPALSQLLNTMRWSIESYEPSFLSGDFNAPSHLDYANLPWPTSVSCVQAGLADSYAELHPTNRTYPGPFAFNDPGITWTPKTSQEPYGVFDRIDFVYYSSGDGVTPTNSVELDERNSIAPWPSDHRAVLTTFQITPPRPLETASLPSPANLAVNVSLNPLLTWLAGSNAISHAVYLGTNEPLDLITNLAESFLALAKLTAGATYYWRVDEATPDGTVTGPVWSFTTRMVNSAVYEWNFIHGDLRAALGNGVLTYADGATTSNLTVFGTTDGSTVPHLGGIPGRYLRAPAFTGIGNGYTAAFSDSLPNGAGQYLNQYTMIFDVLLPPPINWFPFFNTNPANPVGNDADFYIAPDGSIGIAGIGYSAPGLIAANVWHRIAFAADLAAGAVTYYLDGTPVCTGGADLDGRHSLFANAGAAPDLLLFNEGDLSGVYTHAVYLSSFCFTDRTMSATEIGALGGPKARGILVAAPMVQLTLGRNGTNLFLGWEGGDGPFQLQKRTSLTSASWQNVGSPTYNTNATVPVEGNELYFRVSAL